MREFKSRNYEDYFFGVIRGDKIPSFSSIDEAREIFEYGRHMFASGTSVQQPTDILAGSETATKGHKDYVTTLLLAFLHALDSFVSSQSTPLSSKDQIAAAVLELHVLNTYVSFQLAQTHAVLRPHPQDLLPQMKRMAILGEQIASYAASDSLLERSTPSFCLDMGFIIPLYSVASQCQDPMLRRKAIAILRSTPRQEGLWNSVLVAQAAERIMEIEESQGVQLRPYVVDAVAPQAPSFPSILQLDATGGRLQYLQEGGDIDNPVGVVEEIFRW